MIIFCLGMQSSGSTWLYNVVRDILSAAGVPHEAYRAEAYENFLDPRAAASDHAVLRAHNVESLLLRVLKLAEVKAVLSYRDPRDAIVSFLQRFGQYGAKFPRICNDAARNLAALLSASQHLEHISFFYEDGFTQTPQTVHRLAAFLGHPQTEAQAEAIFRKYSADNVRSFTAGFDALPSERRYEDAAHNVMDRLTSFHRTHISDMKVGKWRDAFDPQTRAALTDTFGDYARLLEQKATGAGRRPAHHPDVLPLAPVTVAFSSRLFAPIDDMDNFKRYLTAAELNGDLGIRSLDYLYLPEGEWELTLRAPQLSRITATVCQNGCVLRAMQAEQGELTFGLENELHDHPFDLHLTYQGMQADIAAGAPPPQVVLTASLRPRQSAAHDLPREQDVAAGTPSR